MNTAAFVLALLSIFVLLTSGTYRGRSAQSVGIALFALAYIAQLTWVTHHIVSFRLGF